MALPNSPRLDRRSHEPISSLFSASQGRQKTDNFPADSFLELEMRAPPRGGAFHTAYSTPTDPVVNVMINSFKGLALTGQAKSRNTVCIPLRASSTIQQMHGRLATDLRVPSSLFHEREDGPPLLVTTSDGSRLDRESKAPLSSLFHSADDHDSASMLSIRVAPRVLGGKGGFGSQLRAAGGRMSSRKNKNQTAEQQNASNRNLDGRRIRTITEAKNLATYLAMKPDMDKKEREEKRKRWEAVVEAAERKEDEIKRGKGGNVRLDGQWVEQKEEVEGKTRDAVLAALKAGFIGNEAAMLERTGSESSDHAEGDSDEVLEGEASASSSSSDGDERAAASKPVPAAPASRTFFGWDEDDEDMSDEGSEDEEDEIAPVVYEGKGKGKA